MIYTDGKPTISSRGTQIKAFGINQYPKKKSKVIVIDLDKLDPEEKEEALKEVFEGK